MTPLQMMVLAGILMLITALNLKLAILYIERKEAKRVLERYNGSQSAKETMPTAVSFALSEIKCVESVAKNIEDYLHALTSHDIEKIGIIKEDALVAVIVPLEVMQQYEHLLAAYSDKKCYNP